MTIRVRHALIGSSIGGLCDDNGGSIESPVEVSWEIHLHVPDRLVGDRTTSRVQTEQFWLFRSQAPFNLIWKPLSLTSQPSMASLGSAT